MGSGSGALAVSQRAGVYPTKQNNVHIYILHCNCWVNHPGSTITGKAIVHFAVQRSARGTLAASLSIGTGALIEVSVRPPGPAPAAASAAASVVNDRGILTVAMVRF
jgi:hypothetical protein